MEQTRPAVKVTLKQFIDLVDLRALPKFLVVLILGLSLVSTIASLVVPWFTKNIIDVMTVKSLDLKTILLLLGSFIIQAASAGFSTYFLAFLGEKVVANLRKRLWNKTLVLPVSYFDHHQSGETVSRINNDTAVIKNLISVELVSIFTGVISLIGSLVVLLYLDWSMTLVMLTSVPIIFFIMRPIGRKMYSISKSLQGEMASFTSLLTQVVSEIRLVKAYVAEQVEKKNGEQKIDHLFQVSLKEAKWTAVLQPMMSFVMMFMLVVIIGYGGYRVASGALSAGDLVAFILYLFQIIMPLTMMTRFVTSVQKAMGATERLMQILDHEQEEVNSGNKKIDLSQPIHFDQVKFAYPDHETVIHGVSFTIHPGKITAIVGPSGSGKTTLFALLERFYQPTEGAIRLGDTPLSEFGLRQWRSEISYVSQESPLLAGTIRENICYGMDREVSDEELERAAELAYADEFIRQLPNGFDTEVGERGIMLSGGQRQRIAIARAILHDPKILMLDEATSALDSTSEKVVQEALQNLMKGRTTLVIAHRLSTVVDADQILVLEKGRVTGMGNHEQLLRDHPLYRKLVEQQFKWELQNGRAS
ncbi:MULTISPECIES: ABC transporter ATP-binding protein [unclassified Thermoactinomyces]|jgi:ATP-binding cassette subfamily B protein AbcA/BmrA|uniref:ABC transporter ATP-binding protein n=1 Tax=unclassified Thermoactinomyces TaxID=2634588 RepID=UPI0018DB95F9|nr:MULTISPECIES: ABC transporter ATP-binding protein [unclassified Thermoactinomyces]MBH8605196.1 ABC transporter ATP-binding protein [Thermoactinomyces sp. CICC 10522]MBH8608267.1 ABC transporter ATP-binding protein [Thermoactinomyces sp. CICC 10521]